MPVILQGTVGLSPCITCEQSHKQKAHRSRLRDSHFVAILRVYDLTTEVEILLWLLASSENVLITQLMKQRRVLEKQSSSVIRSVKEIDLYLIIYRNGLMYLRCYRSKSGYPQCFMPVRNGSQQLCL